MSAGRQARGGERAGGRGHPPTCFTEPPLPAGGAWLTLSAMPCSLLMGTEDTSLRM